MEHNKFDGNRWYQKEIDRRTLKAIREKNDKFCEDYADATRLELILNVLNRARILGHTPQAAEVIGSELMIKRFGTWENVISAARLPPAQGKNKLTGTVLFKEERRKQIRLYKEEQRKKKEEESHRLARREEQRGK